MNLFVVFVNNYNSVGATMKQIALYTRWLNMLLDLNDSSFLRAKLDLWNPG